MFKKIRFKIYFILHRSEKYFKTDMIYLARGGFWMTVGQLSTTLLSFLSAIAFANLLPKEIYGSYKYVFSVLGILSVSTLLAMDNAVVRAIARGFDGTVIKSLKTKIRWGVWGSLASFVVTGYYFWQGNAELSLAFLIVAIFLPFIDSISIYAALLQGKKMFGVSNRYKIYTQVLSFIPLIITLFLTNQLWIILLAYFLPRTFIRFIFLQATLKKYLTNKKVSNLSINFGKHLSLTKCLDTLAENLDKVLLWHYLGPIQVAIYSFSFAPFSHLRSLIKKVFPLALPKLSEKKFSEIQKTLGGKIFKMFLGILPAVILYIFLAPYLFKIFFPEYMDSVIYSQVLALTLLFQPKGLILTAFNATLKKKKIYISTIITSLVKIVALLICLPVWGIWGAIIAIFIAQMVNLFVLIFLFKKK